MYAHDTNVETSRQGALLAVHVLPVGRGRQRQVPAMGYGPSITSPNPE